MTEWSLWQSVWGWNTVDNLLLIPSIPFNSLISPAINWGPLSEMILSGSLCNFHTLSLNNRTNPSADVFSIVGIKCTILVNLLTTTKIGLYPWAKCSFVIKSADICIQGFSRIELGISLPAGGSVRFLFCWQASHPSTYLFTSLVTPGHQKFQVTNSTVFHCPPWSPTGVSWCSLIISVLSLL